VDLFQSIKSLQTLYLEHINDIHNNLRSQIKLMTKSIQDQVLKYKFDITKMQSQIVSVESAVTQLCIQSTSQVTTTNLQQGMRPKIIATVKQSFTQLIQDLSQEIVTIQFQDEEESESEI
jgi:hypothetical protein